MHPSWQNILRKYCNKPLYVKGVKTQPIFSLSAKLKYNGRAGSIRFSWEDINTKRDPGLIWHKSYNPEKTSYAGATEVFLELPSDKCYFKLFTAGNFVKFFYSLHPLRKRFGDPYFDNLFVLLEKPNGAIQPVFNRLQLLIMFEWHKSMFLTTDFIDPATVKNYLHLRIYKLIFSESDLEAIFKYCDDLITELYRY
ncbi:hypothetical protein DVR12_09395 [Chitinophaga silvatica]|uniref:Uncharacterized protein n=1 Tax=Chitinophaga silvatica TaxID=2282649 RepID=A0A3E1YBN6_9BACT|nr:hypothetical protein [Chitinophaga silvatica]RFS23224.1 hypothetical protein DVR12_09395 [Chitinophaga silvatica]